MSGIVVAGHICLDLVPALDHRPDLRPGALAEVGPAVVSLGGCVGNTASGLRLLGQQVVVAADVGTDALGSVLEDQVLRSELSPLLLRRVRGAATSYSIVLASPGADRSFLHHVGANAWFDGRGVAFEGCRLLHVGYPSLLPALLKDAGAPLLRLFRRARASGATTSLDLATVDPRTPAGRVDWSGLLARLLPLVDVISPSVDDLTTALHCRPSDARDDPAALAADLVSGGAGVALVTAGSRGMALATAPAARLVAGGPILRPLASTWSQVRHRHASDPVEVRDATGAGDWATAGLLAALVRGLAPRAAVDLAVAAALRRLRRREEPTATRRNRRSSGR